MLGVNLSPANRRRLSGSWPPVVRTSLRTVRRSSSIDRVCLLRQFHRRPAPERDPPCVRSRIGGKSAKTFYLWLVPRIVGTLRAPNARPKRRSARPKSEAAHLAGKRVLERFSATHRPIDLRRPQIGSPTLDQIHSGAGVSCVPPDSY